MQGFFESGIACDTAFWTAVHFKCVSADATRYPPSSVGSASAESIASAQNTTAR